jgi:hypothetical protein
MRWLIRGTTSRRTLRDGSVNDSVPGNELPGYDHCAPTGRRLRRVAVSPRRRFAHSPTRGYPVASKNTDEQELVPTGISS